MLIGKYFVSKQIRESNHSHKRVARHTTSFSGASTNFRVLVTGFIKFSEWLTVSIISERWRNRMNDSAREDEVFNKGRQHRLVRNSDNKTLFSGTVDRPTTKKTIVVISETAICDLDEIFTWQWEFHRFFTMWTGLHVKIDKCYGKTCTTAWQVLYSTLTSVRLGTWFFLKTKNKNDEFSCWQILVGLHIP